MAARVLTFKNNNFVLVDRGLETTIDLRDAVKFRQHSDDIAKRVFKRALITHYDVSLPRHLTFLDPHQIEGVKWILGRSRSYLAHAPGAGKTAQAIVASLLAEGPGQTIFIVPPTLTKNWEREILKFTAFFNVWPSIGVVTLSNRQELVAWNSDFLIVPDSMLAKSWVYDRLTPLKKKLIAVDEASRFKEPTAERSIAFYGGTSSHRSYKGIFRTARHVVLMDGSPMPNRSIELWAPCFALHPEAIDCMSYDDFGRHYGGARMGYQGRWEYRHSSNEEELKAKLQKDFMHVVTEDMLDHPERRRSMLFTNSEVKKWEKTHLTTMSIRDAAFGEDASQGDLATLRREVGISKIEWVTKYIAERLENENERILLFAWHREVTEGLSKALKKFKPGLIIGGVPHEKREEILTSFEKGSRRLIIGNIQALGRGHNIQKATRVVFAEFSWTDELNKQCEKRSSRRGNQASFIPCEYIVAPGSIDEPVLNSLFNKERRVKRVIG